VALQFHDEPHFSPPQFLTLHPTFFSHLHLLLTPSLSRRLSGDAQGAIAVLQRGLEAPQAFMQADTPVRASRSLSYVHMPTNE